MYLSAYAESVQREKLFALRNHSECKLDITDTLKCEDIFAESQRLRGTVKFPGDDGRHAYPALEHVLLRISQDECGDEAAVTPAPNSDSPFVHKVQRVP